MSDPNATMTPDIVSEAVERLRSMADDYEIAHSCEDELHRAVLLAIAEGRCEQPAECARIALTTSSIEFGRFCA